MKFPLPKNLFPPLELTEHQEEQYEQLANSLIKSTLVEYDRFVMHDRKRVDSRRWKAVRKREEVTIYRERASEAHPGPSALALYRSDSKGSYRAPNSTTNASTVGSSRAALYRTMSLSEGHSFGLADTPKKPEHGPVKEDGDDSDDTERDSSEQTQRSAAGLAGAAFSMTDDQGKSGSLPRMLAVGALRGSLDDVMYGVVSPNASTVRVRSSYLGDDIADCAVLREIKTPSTTDPFRFLGIKWLVRTKHRRTRFVLPRDFVVLEYSGVMLRPDNTRVGFHLMHSVEIPDCRELRDLRILRAKVSSCYIYEESRSSRVDVFMTANVEPRGRVLERVALRSAATALSSCWQSVACAHSKKLAFCLQNDRPSATGNSTISSTAQSTRGATALSPIPLFGERRGSGEGSVLDQASQRSTKYSSQSARRQCGVCRGKLGVLTKAAMCQLCGEKVCHRCRLVRKLWTETLGTQVTKSAVVFCKKCVASVSDESAMEIARQELWDTRASSRGRRTRASSAGSTTSSTALSDVFSSERNTYLSVVLGRGSEASSNDSSRGSTASTSLNMSRRTSNGQPQDDVLGHSVGPAPARDRGTSAVTPAKPLSFSLSGMGSLSTATGSTEALSLGDLECEANGEPTKTSEEEPVMLDHRMTLTIRSLRHMDYVNLSDADLELKDEDLESLAPSEASEEDEGVFRSSEASSVAVMDEDFELRSSETNMDELAPHHEVSAIAEEAEPEENTDKSGTEAKDEEEKVEVVEAAPVAEVKAVLMSSSAQDDTSHLANDDSGIATVTPRLRRALTAAPARTTTTPGTTSYQSQLYQQMQDLHSVAESTYQVARANTEAVLADRDSGRLAKPKTTSTTSSLRGVRTFSQPFAFNVVGLRSTRPINVGMGINK